MGEIGENNVERGVTGEIVEDSGSSKEDTDSDDDITSSQRPRVVFYQGDRPPRFGGMLTLKKKPI